MLINQAKSLSNTVILDTEAGQPYNRVLKQFMVMTTHKNKSIPQDRR